MVSVVVLSKNEEKNIEACLKTLEWCEEIIIVDDYSTDQTIRLISQIGAIRKKIKIFQHHLNNNFAAQRNFGLEKAGESFDSAQDKWVLFVDADERVTKELAREVQRVTSHVSPITGFYLKRKDYLFGKWLEHGETANIKLLRLAKKGAGEWVRPVHETWPVRGEIGELANPLLHYPHQTIREFLEEINFYTDSNAQAFYRQGLRASRWQILVYPLAKFTQNYFFKLGFLDGLPGLLSAILMSFHSFLTRAKLWFLQNEAN